MNYSQNNEQQHILDYFGDYVGTLCDLGANDGVTFSNTRALVERGWSGVMVEPSPKAYEKLQSIYHDNKKIKTYQYAIGDPSKKLVFNESSNLINSKDVALVSTFYQSEMERFQGVTTYTPVEVRIFKWKTALNRWRAKSFDMLSIDIEGSEMDVLPDIDLTNTKLICIEWNSKPELKRQYDAYMHGFNIIYTSGENLIYAK